MGDAIREAARTVEAHTRPRESVTDFKPQPDLGDDPEWRYTKPEAGQPSDKLGSDFPMSVERGCGATGKGGTHDAPGQPAQDLRIPDDGCYVCRVDPKLYYEEGKADALVEVRALIEPYANEVYDMDGTIRRILAEIDGVAPK